MTVDRVQVGLGDRSYDICIGRGMLEDGWDGLPERARAVIVSDAAVDALYGQRCGSALKARGWDVERMTVPAGETSKTFARLESLCDRAVAAGLDRSAVVVALGGGMVGDLAGFFASAYLRGVRLVQVPTSLLAMVDSSVGGKTAVNLSHGKNLVGAFYQPIRVVIDLECLDTLPEREYVSGLAEVVKYGVIWDAELFARLEEDAQAVRARAGDAMREIIARCCEIKAEVVAMDEREGGVRAVLNFGHTFAHGVESVLGYGTWLHGEAVAAGMELAGRISMRHKGFDADEHARLCGFMRQVGLPGLDHADIRAQPWPRYREAMASDKKASAGRLRWVLAERMGSVAFGCEVPETVCEEAFTAEE